MPLPARGSCILSAFFERTHRRYLGGTQRGVVFGDSGGKRLEERCEAGPPVLSLVHSVSGDQAQAQLPVLPD